MGGDQPYCRCLLEQESHKEGRELLDEKFIFLPVCVENRGDYLRQTANGQWFRRCSKLHPQLSRSDLAIEGYAVAYVKTAQDQRVEMGDH